MSLETGPFSLIQEPETVSKTANILYAADNGVHGFLTLRYYVMPQLKE